MKMKVGYIVGVLVVLLFIATIAFGSRMEEFPAGIQTSVVYTPDMPEYYGCVPDNSTDCGPSIISAMAASKVVKFGQGTYKVANGGFHFTNVNGTGFVGSGSSVTYIRFANPSDHLIHVTIGFAGLRLQGLTLQGPGKTVGTIDGFYASHYDIGMCGYDWTFDDMVVENVSRDGIYSTCAFQQHFRNCSAGHSIGRNGAVIGGDQFPEWDGTNQYGYDIGGYALWFLGSDPQIRSVNIGDANVNGVMTHVHNGIKFGTETTDVPEGIGLSWDTSSNPTLRGFNFEDVDENGTGIFFAGGNFADAESVIIYSPSISGPMKHASYCVHYKRMDGPLGRVKNFNCNEDQYGESNRGRFRHNFVIDYADPNYTGLVFSGGMNPFTSVQYNYNIFRDRASQSTPSYTESFIVYENVSANSYTVNKTITANNFVSNDKSVYGRFRVIRASDSPTEWSRTIYGAYESTNPTHLSDNDTVLQTRTDGTRYPDDELLCNADTSAISINLDHPVYQPGRQIIVKNTSDSGYPVIVSTWGASPANVFDDNSTSRSITHVYLSQYESVTFITDGLKWYRTGGFKDVPYTIDIDIKDCDDNYTNNNPGALTYVPGVGHYREFTSNNYTYCRFKLPPDFGATYGNFSVKIEGVVSQASIADGNSTRFAVSASTFASQGPWPFGTAVNVDTTFTGYWYQNMTWRSSQSGNIIPTYGSLADTPIMLMVKRLYTGTKPYTSGIGVSSITIYIRRN